MAWAVSIAESAATEESRVTVMGLLCRACQTLPAASPICFSTLIPFLRSAHLGAVQGMMPVTRRGLVVCGHQSPRVDTLGAFASFGHNGLMSCGERLALTDAVPPLPPALGAHWQLIAAP